MSGAISPSGSRCLGMWSRSMVNVGAIERSPAGCWGPLGCLSVMSCRRSQDVEEATGGLLEVGGLGRGAVADDVGELGRARRPEAVGGPRPEGPAAVQAEQGPDRDTGPAGQDPGNGLGLPAEAASGL